MIQRQLVRCTINGKERETVVDVRASLTDMLRNDYSLTSVKKGCEVGECGACTVIIDGVAARSCVFPLSGAEGRTITTLEGIGTREHPHRVQQAFIDEQAAQCGYCMNGMIMTAKALLDRNPHPSEEQIRNELSANLCRCGTHIEIMRAVMLAARPKP